MSTNLCRLFRRIVLSISILLAGLGVVLPTVTHAAAAVGGSIVCSGNDVIASWYGGTDGEYVRWENNGNYTANSGSGSYTIPGPGTHTVTVIIVGNPNNLVIGPTTITCPSSTPISTPVSVPGCEMQYPVLSQARVPNPVTAYWAPNKGAVTRADGSVVTLPLNANHDGKDTYLVISKQTINGVVWVGLFLGSCDPAWLPLTQVQLLAPLS